MSDNLEYKGYRGSIEYSREDHLFFGKVLFIDSLLMYHGTSVDEIEQAFKETVDAYLDHCERTGKSPNKPYSGTFNVRIGPDLHRDAVQIAAIQGMSLNQFVGDAIQQSVDSAKALKTLSGLYLSAINQQTLPSSGVFGIANLSPPVIDKQQQGQINPLNIQDMVSPHLTRQ